MPSALELEHQSFVNQLREELANGVPEDEIIRRVNNFFNNKIAYGMDLVVQGVPDHWSKPVETLRSRKGDCEDYAIAKLSTLLRVGINMACLAIVVILKNKSTHAVCIANGLVMDDPSVNPLLLPMYRRADIRIVETFTASFYNRKSVFATRWESVVRFLTA